MDELTQNELDLYNARKWYLMYKERLEKQRIELIKLNEGIKSSEAGFNYWKHQAEHLKRKMERKNEVQSS